MREHKKNLNNALEANLNLLSEPTVDGYKPTYFVKIEHKDYDTALFRIKYQSSGNLYERLLLKIEDLLTNEEEVELKHFIIHRLETLGFETTSDND